MIIKFYSVSNVQLFYFYLWKNDQNMIVRMKVKKCYKYNLLHGGVSAATVV